MYTTYDIDAGMGMGIISIDTPSDYIEVSDERNEGQHQIISLER